MVRKQTVCHLTVLENWAADGNENIGNLHCSRLHIYFSFSPLTYKTTNKQKTPVSGNVTLLATEANQAVKLNLVT